MKNLIVLLLCLFLLGLVACEDKKTPETSAAIETQNALVTDASSGKTPVEEFSGLGKEDRAGDESATAPDKELGEMVIPPVAEPTIPAPEPVEPPLVVQTTEETTVQE